MAEAAEVMEQTEVQPQKKVVGFAKRSVNKERIEKEEKEIEELKKQNLEQVDVTPEEKEEPEPTTAEERSFKKRYGDLRRHSQKKEHDLQKQIDELRNQLDASTKKQIKLPKSEEELDEWTKEQSKDIEDKLKKINAMQEDALREKAEVLLLKKHPDFVEIREQDEFHNWVEEQPEWVQKALYENEHDANSAARAIDLYKADMGISTKKITTKDKELSAAKSVGKTQKKNPDSSSEVGMIKESDVEKMTPKQYEANAEAIQKAMQSGKFIYDLTGSAR